MSDSLDQSLADLSGINGNRRPSVKGYFVGSVFLKAFVEVNDKGTEAAAAAPCGDSCAALVRLPSAIRSLSCEKVDGNAATPRSLMAPNEPSTGSAHRRQQGASVLLPPSAERERPEGQPRSTTDPRRRFVRER